MFADFQAFPFDQLTLMAAMKNQEFSTTIPEGIMLKTALMTTAPPFLSEPGAVMQAHQRVAGLVHGHQTTRWIFGLQHPPIAPGKLEIGEADLRSFKETGVQVMAIAYKEANPLAGGFASQIGLTTEGQRFLTSMAKAGIVLDLSHAGHQSARDALDFIYKESLPLRVCATHGGCHAVYGHPRNLPDDVTRKIASNGGLIGLVTVPWMLSATDNSMHSILPHLGHLMNLVGPEYICFGTDAIYRSMSEADRRRLFDTLSKTLDNDGAFQARYPIQPEELNGPALMQSLHRLVEKHFDKPTADLVCGDTLSAYLAQL